ncbi:hypothetical protein V1517DRAFT_354895 [Lipomyces orientalis]|uniref:Uncharacterized protein n=1 Tax=Lipomyces orientalis TaxID=1233043 RepID=A0ACC3TF90_9ASCO
MHGQDYRVRVLESGATPGLRLQLQHACTAHYCIDSFTRPRGQPGVDYLLLNDGYEGDEPVENVSLTRGPQSPVETSFELGPEDSISQIVDPSLSRILTDEAQEISPVLTDDRISSQRRRGTANHWLWEQFEVTTLNQQTPLGGTSTTNMSYHLQRAHSLGISNDTKNQSTIMTMWKQKETKELSLGRAYKTTIYCH